MTVLLLHKTLSGNLATIDDAGKELLAKIGRGEIVSAEIKRPRNIKFHRRFFAMLNLVLANQSHYQSLDDLLDVCKLRIGHVKVIQTKHGEVRIPKSISFAALDDAAFSAFYDRAVDWVIAEVIPGLRRADLDEEVENEIMEFASPRGY